MISQSLVIMKRLKSLVYVGASGSITFGLIGIWTGHEKFYEQILNPYLNRVDPEFSHRMAIFLTKYHLIKKSDTNDPQILSTKIGDLSLTNPIGLAAGFDKSGECMSGLTRLGLGWIEIGSVTPKPQEGNDKPRVFRLPEDYAVINRYGFNNDGHEKVLTRLKEFKAEQPQYKIGVNLGANKDSTDRIKDYTQGILVFGKTADYFVINVSSPNTPNLRNLQNEENLDVLLKKVIETRNASAPGVPIFLKISPDLEDKDISSICRSVTKKEQRVDALIISNTTIKREGLKSQENLVGEMGGLSGLPLREPSTRLIQRFYKELRGEVPIVGVGGVWSGEDAFDKICAGAHAVQIYTSLTYKGPRLVERIKEELSTILTNKGFKSVIDAVGTNVKK